MDGCTAKHIQAALPGPSGIYTDAEDMQFEGGGRVRGHLGMLEEMELDMSIIIIHCTCV